MYTLTLFLAIPASASLNFTRKSMASHLRPNRSSAKALQWFAATPVAGVLAAASLMESSVRAIERARWH